MQDLFGSLEEEWRRLVGSGGGRRALERWRTAAPELAEIASLDELVAAVRAGAPTDTGHARALAWLAEGDEVAARTLLQAVLPSLVCLVRRSGRCDPDAAGSVVGLAWIRIRTYPRHRPGDVAANLYWDIRKQYLRSRGEPTEQFCGDDPSLTAPSAEALALDRMSVAGARSDLDRITGSSLAFGMVWATRVEGWPPSAVASACGLSRHGLVQRRRRAESAMRRSLDG